METVCEYTDNAGYMTISTDEKRLINKLLRIAEDRPEEVTILARPEKNDGCLYLRCPKNYLKIKPPVRMNLSDEERIIRRQRLQNARQNQ